MRSKWGRKGLVVLAFEIIALGLSGLVANSAFGSTAMPSIGARDSLVGVAAEGPSLGRLQTGYWLIQADGQVLGFGNAVNYTPQPPLNPPARVVGGSRTPRGAGYWLVASDGGIFTFGDAHFYGSTGNVRLAQPIVGMASTPDGHGYWLVASDGGIFTFGNAEFDGSLGGFGYPARTVAVLSQTPPLGTVAASSPVAGRWESHNATIAISNDGRFALDYRTYNWCNLPGAPRGPGPCDYLAGNLIIPGGSVGGQVTSATANTATTAITWDPAGVFRGLPSKMTYDPAHNALIFGPFTLCGPIGLANSYCGA
jgi:hypothetical protein